MERTEEEKCKNLQSGILYKYAQLIIDISGLGVKTFSYIIPDEFRETIKIGQAVLVSFGNKGLVTGFVVGFSNYLPDNIKAKSIIEIIDAEPLFNLDYLNFLQYIGNYYCCSLQTMIEVAVPMKFLKQSKNIVTLINKNSEKQIGITGEKIINLLCDNNISTSVLQKKVKLPSAKFYAELRKLKTAGMVSVQTEFQSSVQKEQTIKFIRFVSKKTDNKRYLKILEEIEHSNEEELIAFEKRVKTTRKTVQHLANEKLVEIFEKNVFRNPLDIYKLKEKESFYNLSAEQNRVFEFLKRKIDKRTCGPVLLHGVTSSGKTEIYFHAIDYVLQQGKNVLFIVPEIALASEITRRLARRFGTDTVAIWHSSISDGERFDIWQKLRNNEIKILAGARSAVFAPLQNIGLIIIDEEHENSFKQTSPTPRYNAKHVAEELAKLTNATVVLGSATPDVSTYYRAKNTNNLVSISERFNNAKMAKVVTIDMHLEKMNGNNSLFSRTLTSAIERNIKEKKQSIILINRRGFATTTQCEDCGKVISCPKCDIPLVYHRQDELLKCHYCDYTQGMPKTCPDCNSQQIFSSGIGIEKVEKITRQIFQNAKIARIDSDVINKKNLCAEIFEEFRNGEIDILIGTQMIAKGLDNPNVTLVGVINADSSFTFPDFRCSERGFQLLTQVAGRAGRGQQEGKVYFQTFNPNFCVLDNAKNQDYKNFYTTEIEAREQFDYPPFSQMIVLFLSSKQEWKAITSAKQIAEKLREVVIKKDLSEYINILGPTPCIFERLKEEYRFQIMIKNKLGEKGHTLLTRLFKGIILPEDIKLVVDIDPLDVM